MGFWCVIRSEVRKMNKDKMLWFVFGGGGRYSSLLDPDWHIYENLQRSNYLFCVDRDCSYINSCNMLGSF